MPVSFTDFDMTLQATNLAGEPASPERGPVVLMATIGLALICLVALDTGARGVALFALGGAL
ncbi:MAG: hypothetical protein VXW06_06515, partial [Pseudomonadota bacterium]|nr:hypothetical protein [Pseudomonadota bacterium]